jgi:hypothetical protein
MTAWTLLGKLCDQHVIVVADGKRLFLYSKASLAPVLLADIHVCRLALLAQLSTRKDGYGVGGYVDGYCKWFEGVPDLSHWHEVVAEESKDDDSDGEFQQFTTREDTRSRARRGGHAGG